MNIERQDTDRTGRKAPRAERIGELVSLLLPGFRASGFCSGEDLGELALDGILCIAESCGEETGKLLFLVLDPPGAEDALALQFQIWELLGSFLPVHVYSLLPVPAETSYGALLEDRAYARACTLFGDFLPSPWLPLAKACTGLFIIREAGGGNFAQRWANFAEMMAELHGLPPEEGAAAVRLMHAGLCRKAAEGRTGGAGETELRPL